MPKIIEIDGIIGIDVWPSMISRELRAAAGEDVELLFSSPGGYIDDGLAIFNLIHDYEGRTTAKIIGVAASMASYIPLAADKVIAKSNAVYMIHDALMATYGNEAEHTKTAKILGGFSNLLADIYAKKTGKTVDKIRALMQDESYFFGSEMLDAGFVDEIDEIEVNDEREKDDVVLDVMMKVELATGKVKEKPEDYSKIAALLPKSQASGPAKPANKRSSAESKNPNEEKHMDPKTMTLAEFLAQNSGANAEHQKALDDAKAEGNTEGIAAKQAEIDRIHPLITAEGASAALIESGFKALKGESSVDSFVAIADYETRVKQEDAAKKAAEESEELGDNENGQQKQLSTNGKISTKEDEEAEKALFAKIKGKEKEVK